MRARLQFLQALKRKIIPKRKEAAKIESAQDRQREDEKATRVVKEDHRAQVGGANRNKQQELEQRLTNKGHDKPRRTTRPEQKKKVYQRRCFREELAIERRGNRVKMDSGPEVASLIGVGWTSWAMAEAAPMSTILSLKKLPPP